VVEEVAQILRGVVEPEEVVLGQILVVLSQELLILVVGVEELTILAMRGVMVDQV
jgi:hypothetical protein